MLNKSVCKTHNVPYSMNSAQKRCDNFLGTRTLILFCRECMWHSFYLEGVDSMQYWTRLFVVLKSCGCSIAVVCSPNQDTMSLIPVWRMCYACSKGATPQLYKTHGSFQFSGCSCVCCSLLHAGWHGPSARVFPSFFFFYIGYTLCTNFVLCFCNTKDCNIFFFFLTEGFSINSERRRLCQCVFYPAV